MISHLELIAAFSLDLVIGDPKWLPHPVKIIGGGVNRLELFLRKYFKTPRQERFAGAVLVIFIIAFVFFICVLILKISYRINAIFGTLALIYLASTTIAARELINSARLVIKKVKDRNIEDARHNLSMIVGRDTENLSEEEILKATIETLAENLSDGIVAPIIYLTIGGLPLAMTYKAINTMDSMLGYKNEKYKIFGWAAARLDDIANYIPARITGVLIAVSSAIVFRSPSIFRSSLKTMHRDGRKHPSPNSGMPEAAAAGALGVRLGGTSSYGGITIEKAYIGIENSSDYLFASEKTIVIVKVASMLFMLMAAGILYTRGIQ